MVAREERWVAIAVIPSGADHNCGCPFFLFVSAFVLFSDSSDVVIFAKDYIFSLLTGYCDPPANFELREGMAYNPYFPGQAIGMPQQLYQDSVTYEDGMQEKIDTTMSGT